MYPRCCGRYATHTDPARAFFARPRQSLTPYTKCAAMFVLRWDGSASYCHHENMVSLSLVEERTIKCRFLPYRAHGYRDADSRMLSIAAAFLPSLIRSADEDPL